MANNKHVVVNLVGEPTHGLLAESRFVPRPFLPGGEHNMYELAFAAASLGYEVELRGWLDRPTFDRISQEVSAAPRVELPARLPQHGELVVVPEGWRDPLEYLRLLLSPARVAVHLLAAPGLFGWPFCGPGWEVPDPLTVPLDALARPEHFQAMHGLGIPLLTPSPGIAEAAEAAGVPCALVGTAEVRPPTPPPAPTPRLVDAVGLLANRWAPLVREVARELEGLEVDLIDEVSNDEVRKRFARARILIWPSRVEGHAKINWEARSVGCVPVALSTNRFAAGLTQEGGVVLVDRVEEIAPAIRELLGDERRWEELSRRAMRRAPEEARWDSFVARVGEFLEGVAITAPELDARAGMGTALRNWIQTRADDAQRSLESLEEVKAELERVREDRDALHAVAAELRADRDRMAQALEGLRQRRAVKVALRLADATKRHT